MSAISAGFRRSRHTLLHAVLIVGSLIMAYPLLWMAISAFKPNSEIFSQPLALPASWTWDSFKRGWSAIPGHSFGRFFLNTLFISAATVAGSLVSSTLTAFAFARLTFRLRDLWFAVMMMTMMLPFQVTLIPQYILFHRMGWVNTYLPLLVPQFLGVNAFFIFLLVQFIRGLPKELDEAAKMDGCSAFGIYSRIVMPLCAPALMTVAIFSFIWSWDDFFSQLIYINDVSKYTVSLGLQLFLDSQGVSQWGPMLAMSVLSLVPCFLVFLLFQRYIVQGISTTGLKG